MLPVHQIPLTTVQQQQLKTALSNLQERTNTGLTSFFSQILTITTGLCIYSLAIVPTDDSKAINFILLFISTGWGLTRLMQIMITITAMAAIRILMRRQDFFGLVIAIGTYI
jgi:predicted GTPase